MVSARKCSRGEELGWLWGSSRPLERRTAYRARPLAAACGEVARRCSKARQAKRSRSPAYPSDDHLCRMVMFVPGCEER